MNVQAPPPSSCERSKARRRNKPDGRSEKFGSSAGPASTTWTTMACILITGGAGYVGSHCAKALAAAGHEGIVFDNLSCGHREFVRSVPLIEGDIRDAAALDAVFSGYRFDAVMHFAALAYVGESVTAPGRYYDINVNGTRTVLDAMVRAGVRSIVFSSSCAIYGEPDTMPINERTVPNPINPYGFSKLVCERMMDDFDCAHELKSA